MLYNDSARFYVIEKYFEKSTMVLSCFPADTEKLHNGSCMESGMPNSSTFQHKTKWHSGLLLTHVYLTDTWLCLTQQCLILWLSDLLLLDSLPSDSLMTDLLTVCHPVFQVTDILTDGWLAVWWLSDVWLTYFLASWLTQRSITGWFTGVWLYD